VVAVERRWPVEEGNVEDQEAVAAAPWWRVLQKKRST